MIALATGAMITLGLAVAIALQPPHAGPPRKPDVEPPAPTQEPTIPETIRKALPTGPGSARRPRRSPFTSPRDGGGGEVEVGRTARSDRDRHAALLSEENQRALGASILFDVRSAVGDPNPPTRAVSSADGPGGAGAAALLGTTAGSAAALDDPGGQWRKSTFLESQGTSRTSDTLEALVVHPRSPYELQAGTIVPAVLITAINSDLPGPVVAQVRENVYDTVTGR